MRESLRDRSAPVSYRDRVDGTRRANRRTNHILKESANVELWSPVYDRTMRESAVLRILPQPIIGGDGSVSWTPWRVGPGPRDFGGWLANYPCAVDVGQPSVSFVLYDPLDSRVDPNQVPYNIFRNRIIRAVTSGVAPNSWALLFKKAGDRRSQLDDYNGEVHRFMKWGNSTDAYRYDITFVMGVLASHRDKVYNPPRGVKENDKFVMFKLAGGATSALIAMMNEQIEPVPATGMEFVWDDPISLTPKQGYWVEWHTVEQYDEERGNAYHKYAVRATANYNGIDADMSALEPMFAQKLPTFSEAIHIPTPEEQVAILCEAFDPSIVWYVFGETHQDWVPDHIRRAMRDRPASMLVERDITTREASEQQVGGEREPFGGTRLPTRESSPRPRRQSWTPAGPVQEGGVAPQEPRDVENRRPHFMPPAPAAEAPVEEKPKAEEPKRSTRGRKAEAPASTPAAVAAPAAPPPAPSAPVEVPLPDPTSAAEITKAALEKARQKSQARKAAKK